MCAWNRFQIRSVSMRCPPSLAGATSSRPRSGSARRSQSVEVGRGRSVAPLLDVDRASTVGSRRLVEHPVGPAEPLDGGDAVPDRAVRAVHGEPALAQRERAALLDELEGVGARVGAAELQTPAAATRRLLDRELLVVLPHGDLPHVLLEKKGAGPGELGGAHAFPLLEARALALSGREVEAKQLAGPEPPQDPAKALGHEADQPVVNRDVLVLLLGIDERARARDVARVDGPHDLVRAPRLLLLEPGPPGPEPPG